MAQTNTNKDSLCLSNMIDSHYLKKKIVRINFGFTMTKIKGRKYPKVPKDHPFCLLGSKKRLYERVSRIPNYLSLPLLKLCLLTSSGIRLVGWWKIHLELVERIEKTFYPNSRGSLSNQTFYQDVGSINLSSCACPNYLVLVIWILNQH